MVKEEVGEKYGDLFFSQVIHQWAHQWTATTCRNKGGGALLGCVGSNGCGPHQCLWSRRGRFMWEPKEYHRNTTGFKPILPVLNG